MKFRVSLLELDPALHALDLRLLREHLKHAVPSIVTIGFDKTYQNLILLKGP